MNCYSPESLPSDFLLALQQRRQRLAQLLDHPVVLWSGKAPPRNFPANSYPFRASSHFLYFAGLPLENAAIRLESGQLELFWDEPTAKQALWQGQMPSRQEIATAIGADRAYPLAELTSRGTDAATIPLPDGAIRQHQCQVLSRSLAAGAKSKGIDLLLAEAIIDLRLSQDTLGLGQIRQAIATSIAAHREGMARTVEAKSEAEVRGIMEGVIIARQMTCAYGSIVTIEGEVLHNERYHHPLDAGDLLLADVGAETALGWASDITRTWPVTGKFSPEQRDIYNVVLAAHDACIAAIAPGMEYRDIHLLGAITLTAGLADLGILRGNPEDLVGVDAHALFFPHGIGHLLGLDVHDMEDLGDLAGYKQGRTRSDRFGLCYLRLDRPLLPGMVVTIEPGFYQVPAILHDATFREKYQKFVNWQRLEAFSQVRGIRIEDDILVTDSGSETLTEGLPVAAGAIEELCRVC